MSEFTPNAFPHAPLRQDELAFVVECLRRGACCAIVGPSILGKSALLRSLPREEVRRACVIDGSPTLLGNHLPILMFVNLIGGGRVSHQHRAVQCDHDGDRTSQPPTRERRSGCDLRDEASESGSISRRRRIIGRASVHRASIDADHRHKQRARCARCFCERRKRERGFD